MTLLSNSDARSPSKLGRDVNVFLEAIISDVTDAGVASKGVTATYHRLLGDLGNELSLLMTASLPDLEAAGGRLLATVIPSLRKGKATIAPGMTESTAPFVSCLRRVRKISPRNRPSSQAYALSLWACPASIFSLSL